MAQQPQKPAATKSNGWAPPGTTGSPITGELFHAQVLLDSAGFSPGVIDGRFGLRACVVNFRTEAEDMDQMLAVAAELGELEHQRTGV